MDEGVYTILQIKGKVIPTGNINVPRIEINEWMVLVINEKMKE